MRRTAFIILTAAIAAGCLDNVGPEGTTEAYALARVGPVRLPVFVGGNQTFPLLLADTLRLATNGLEKNLPFLDHISVLRLEDSQETRSETRHTCHLENDTLTYDGCPIGSACAASFVASSQTFQVVGDSLYQIVQVGANQQPYVYGRVKR